MELEARGDVGSLLELTRAYEDLVGAAHVGQARILSRLSVHEPAEFAPTSEVVPGPEAVTPQEVATVLEMSVESVRTRLAVADTLAVMRCGFADILRRLVVDLDPELAQRSLADALAERAVSIRPDQDVPGFVGLIACAGGRRGSR